MEMYWITQNINQTSIYLNNKKLKCILTIFFLECTISEILYLIGMFMKFKSCEVGMFRLPGIIVEDDDKDDSAGLIKKKLEEIETWSKSEQGTGQRMTDRLWSFRTESQRDWFLLRWSGK